MYYRICAAALLALALGTATFAEVSALPVTAVPKTLDSGQAVAVFTSICVACHDWAKSYGTIVEAAVVVPGKPEASPAWLAISEDRMPPTGALSAAQKALILDWIKSGAPNPAPGDSSLSVPVAPTGSERFMGFRSMKSFHRFSGWASGGILLAAGVVGAIHAYDMMSAAHQYRDSLGIDEFDPTRCPSEIAAVYNDPAEQALRWTHVGLLAAGESFYLANAFTGTSFMGKLGPGWSKSKIHRYAFFVHAGLMVSEAVMGYFSSEALKAGDHDTFHTLLVVHAGVGLVIPVIILGAGAIMSPKVEL